MQCTAQPGTVLVLDCYGPSLPAQQPQWEARLALCFTDGTQMPGTNHWSVESLSSDISQPPWVGILTTFLCCVSRKISLGKKIPVFRKSDPFLSRNTLPKEGHVGRMSSYPGALPGAEIVCGWGLLLTVSDADRLLLQPLTNPPSTAEPAAVWVWSVCTDLGV